MSLTWQDLPNMALFGTIFVQILVGKGSPSSPNANILEQLPFTAISSTAPFQHRSKNDSKGGVGEISVDSSLAFCCSLPRASPL
jgi:hypothetical protein